MKKPRVVLRVLVAFSPAILFPLGLAAPERGLSEEGEGATSLQEEPVEVPRTEEANKLARELIGKLTGSYFSLERAGIDSFNATFEVKCESGAAGAAKLTWNRKDERVLLVGESQSPRGKKRSRKDPPNELLAAFIAPAGGDFLLGLSVGEAKVAEARREMEIGTMSVSLKEIVLPFIARGPFESRPRPGPGVYAVKVGEEFVIDASEQASKDDSGVKSDLFFLGANGRRFRGFLVFLMGDNEVSMETVCEGEEAEGKLFIKSLSATVNHPSLGSVKGEYAFTYTHTQGNVFLKRIVATVTMESEAFWSATAQLKDVRLVGRPAERKTTQ